MEEWISKLVNPNLGRPKILSISKSLKNKKFEMNLLFVSNIKDLNRFEEQIKGQVKLIPIIEHKWKLSLIQDFEKKIKKLRKKLSKKDGFWRSVRKKKYLKKEKNLQSEEGEFKKLNLQALRGAPISPIILNTEEVRVKSIGDPTYDEFYSPQNYLIKNEVYKYLNIFYKVHIEFALTKEIIEFLKERNFVMFDILQESLGVDLKDSINHHSVVVSKQKWKNFTFIHATDLHLAERNDKIYEIIKKWSKLLSVDEQLKLIRTQKKKYEKSAKLKKLISFTKKEFEMPLKKRLINPNNQMRNFIKLINRRVIRNDVDFIVLTGDLVDFTILSKLPKEKRIFDYDHSNWKVFKEIMLNFPQKKRRGMISGEEILCPIFTIPGNHDYRPFHYDMRWAGLYKKIGLKATEALALNDKLFALPITAIMKSNLALKGYLEEINASLDFTLKLGNNNFIFLNTGSDSFKNLRDLVTGHPSLTGLTNTQVKYLENNLKKIQDGDNTFLLLHGPAINPKKKVGLVKRIRKKFGKKFLTKIDEFRESVIKKFEKKTSKTRIDGNFNVKYGTIRANWEKLIKFCKDYCVLTLTGHTHSLKEFRLDDPEGIKTEVYKTPPFSLKKLENPAAIYYDNYSDIYTNAKDIEKFGPFVVQTPALGLGGYKNWKLVGAYRELKIEKGKLASFKVKYLHR